MKDRKIVVLRYQTLADLEKKLKDLGVVVNVPTDQETLQIEGHIERCNTPELTTTVGKVITVWVSAESAALMADVMPPEVLVDWVQGEKELVEVEDFDPETGESLGVTEVMVAYDWPVYQVETEDGIVTQAAPRIMV